MGFISLWIHGNYTHRVLVKIGLHQENNPNTNIETLPTSKIEAGNENAEEYNILIIGNSFTLHGYANYWWSESGMASSKPEKDYVHILTNMLSKKYHVNSTAVNYSTWETMWYDRNETYSLLNGVINDEYDLIIIQLGENMSNIDTAKSDFEELISHINKQCRPAQTMLVGSFPTWDTKQLETIKNQVATEQEITYIDLSSYSATEYLAGMGTTVYGDDGTKHIIEHEGVAIHPGDLGMMTIAAEIYNHIE